MLFYNIPTSGSDRTWNRRPRKHLKVPEHTSSSRTLPAATHAQHGRTLLTQANPRSRQPSSKGGVTAITTMIDDGPRAQPHLGFPVCVILYNILQPPPLENPLGVTKRQGASVPLLFDSCHVRQECLVGHALCGQSSTSTIIASGRLYPSQQLTNTTNTTRVIHSKRRCTGMLLS